MEDKGHNSFCALDSEKQYSESSGPRCKSLYNEWKCPAYYPYHSYKKTKAKSDIQVVACRHGVMDMITGSIPTVGETDSSKTPSTGCRPRKRTQEQLYKP
ncbi:hypothetical protein DPMN_040893 [Dreissena polymorpha]|uniref:Uncharacterized protein n=1 Tax=Dreissena polymorpha TaxID=45954 RepID=A0A9D4HVQ7_DREPO|nr:hypothetical protein DPMN_040893 [Dreissena polymorpha]